MGRTDVCVLAAITFYGVWKLQGAMMNSEQYYNDPRHPRCMSPPVCLLVIRASGALLPICVV